MNAEELSEAVDELDTRLERLRVLYEQYFQGIEKIPPSIVQKDVDRRIWVLRREKIRNTGTRFKFQQIIQRYNTFGAYWMRIMREIENGTYKRDVLRAKKRFGVDVVHPNAKAQVQQQEQAREQQDSMPPPSHELDLSLDDIEEESFDGDDLGELGVLPKAPPLPGRPPPPPPSKPAAPPTPAPARPGTSPLLLGTKPPSAVPAARPLTAPAPARKIEAAQAESVNKILKAPLAADDDLDDMLDLALGPAARAPARPAPKPAPAPEAAKPLPVARPQPIAAAPKPQPIAAPKPQPAPAPKPQPAAPAAAAAGDDYRRVYAAYVEARRKNGESTAGLTYDTLAKSLRDTTEKLKTKAGGKPIDFEVTTKDGRTILKPVVK